MYKNIQDQLRQKEREAHLEETKNFSSKIQQLFKKANENKTEFVVERKQLDSSLVNTFEYKINGLQRAIKEAYARLQIGKYDGFVDIISSYNDICIYLKNIVKYSTLNQTYKVGIDDEMRKVVPALTDIDIYSSNIKKYNVPELKQIINNINNKTYQTIGASASVGFKRVMIDREEFIQKLKSQYTFISTNKHFVKDKKERKILDKYETELEDLMRKAPRWKFDRATKQEELKKEYDNLDNIVEITNNIIQPYLDRYKKTDEQKEQQKQLEKQRQLDQARKALMESKQSVENQISVLEGKIKKEKKKRQKDVLKEKLDELQNDLNMIEEKEKKIKEDTTTAKLPEQNVLMGDRVLEKKPVEPPQIKLELNPPDLDISPPEAPEEKLIDKGEKIEPFKTLRINYHFNDKEEEKFFDKVNSKIRDDDEIGRLLVETQKSIGTFDEKILSVLKKTPQLRSFDHKNIIQMMKLRNESAYEALREKHQRLVYYSNAMVAHLYIDQIGAVINNWRSTHGDIIDDENTRNAIFEASKKEIINDLQIYKERGNELSDEINKYLVSDVLKEIARNKPEPEEKAPEPVQNQANDKQQLLNDNPWLAEVNEDMDYKPDFMAYAGKKRNEEKLDFNTSEKWQIFKKYYNRK